MPWAYIPSGNYTSLLVPEAAYLLECYLDTCPSALSRLTPIVSSDSSTDSAKSTSRHSPSGTTLLPLTASHGVEGSMSSQGDSPAKTSPLPEKERAFLALAAAYGQSSPVCLATYNPATHSLKTPQRLLFEDSQQSLLTLPPWGWMHAGVVSGLMTSGPGMSGKGRGFLPTATRANDAEKRGNIANDVRNGLAMINHLVKRGSLPTPQAYTQNASQLEIAQGNPKSRLPTAVCVALETTQGSSLNPTWEGWYMGWPMDWEAPGMSRTLLTPMAFQQWLLEYRSALNELWRWVMVSSHYARPSRGEY